MDLQPEEPRADSKSNTSSLRVRLGRFNIAVLRVVTASLAGLPDSEQVCLCKLMSLGTCLEAWQDWQSLPDIMQCVCKLFQLHVAQRLVYGFCADSAPHD